MDLLKFLRRYKPIVIFSIPIIFTGISIISFSIESTNLTFKILLLTISFITIGILFVVSILPFAIISITVQNNDKKEDECTQITLAVDGREFQINLKGNKTLFQKKIYFYRKGIYTVYVYNDEELYNKKEINLYEGLEVEIPIDLQAKENATN